MNLTRICRTLSVFVMFLSSISQSRGQTLGNEILVRTGFEPVVNCDHRGALGRIQLVLMDKFVGPTSAFAIYWEVSTNLGLNWTNTAFEDTGETRIDPVATCDIWSADTTRRMYFGWFAQIGDPSGDFFQRSLSGTAVDNATQMQGVLVGAPDRPWLTGNSANLYLSFSGGSSANWGYIKRASIPSGTAPVDWPADSNAQLIFTPDSNTSLVPNFQAAAHLDSLGTERVFMMARQYHSGAGIGPCTFLIKRSVNQGNWTLQETVDVTGADGFPPDRDSRMVADHISCDRSTSVTPTRVYAFYVRNEMATWGRHNVLYCKSSLDGGTTWNVEDRVFTIKRSQLPLNGFSQVPPNGSNNTDGFYRIGRVWSCVDDNGNVYVAWMDNRYGEYNATDKDYWHVFCSRSTNQGLTWSPPIQVSGTTNSPNATRASASIGGYGNPIGNLNANHIPPGDFLTCDADQNRLYVAWLDSRDNQSNTSAPTKVYFRRIQF